MQNDKQNVPNQCKIFEVQLFKMFINYLQLHMHFLHQNYGNLNITHVEEHVYECDSNGIQSNTITSNKIIFSQPSQPSQF
jgi:hypothetical protein